MVLGSTTIGSIRRFLPPIISVSFTEYIISQVWKCMTDEFIDQMCPLRQSEAEAARQPVKSFRAVIWTVLNEYGLLLSRFLRNEQIGILIPLHYGVNKTEVSWKIEMTVVVSKGLSRCIESTSACILSTCVAKVSLPLHWRKQVRWTEKYYYDIFLFCEGVQQPWQHPKVQSVVG